MKLPKEQPAYLEHNLPGSSFDSAKRGHVPELEHQHLGPKSTACMHLKLNRSDGLNSECI
jgi:hypothetical protein